MSLAIILAEMLREHQDAKSDLRNHMRSLIPQLRPLSEKPLTNDSELSQLLALIIVAAYDAGKENSRKDQT
jgi:hypothetical protein